MASRWRERLTAVALLALIVLWSFVGLFGREPWKADEAYTFGLVWSMLQGHGYIAPLLGGEPFVEKPPLFFWTAAAFARTFGAWLSPPDAARLACAFFTTITLAAVAATGRIVTGRHLAAGLSAVALVACIGLSEKVHLLVTDCALLSGVALGLLGISLARARPMAGGLLLAFGGATALLSKGLLGPGILGCTSLALLAAPAWRTPEFKRALRIAALLAIPALLIWPLLLWRQSPDLFHEWFWRNNFGRFFGFARLGEHHRFGYYLWTVPWFAFPAWVLAVVGWRQAASRPGALAPLLPSLLASCIGFVALSAAAESRSIYATILLVPLAPAAAAGALRSPHCIGPRWQKLPTMIFAVVVGVLWLAWIALVAGAPEVLVSWLAKREPGFVPAAHPLGLLLALSATALFGVVARAPAPHAVGWLVRWTAGVCTAWTVLCALWLPYADYGMSYRAVVRSMSAAIPEGARCVASLHLGEPQRALFEYYAGLVTSRVEVDPEAISRCDALLVQQVGETVDPGPRWTEIAQDARPGDERETYRLFRAVR